VNRLSDYQTFLTQFLRNYETTGSVIPSGRALGSALCRYVGQGSGPQKILEAGPGVDPKWKKGDRVLVNPLNKQKGLMGEMMHGGLAEKCLVAADQLIRMPDKVSFEEAASLPVAYGTAHRMIVTHDTIRKGEKVLVLGASGGVGTGCVLLAKNSVDRLANAFQACPLGAGADEHLGGTNQDVLKERQHAAWLEQRAVRLQDVAHIHG